MKDDKDVRCDGVEQRRVASQALAAELAAHAAGCSRCEQREAVRDRVARVLAASGRRAEPIDPGYLARVTAGAEARLARGAGPGRWPALAGAAVACAALVVWLGARERTPLATSVELARASAGAALLLDDAGDDKFDHARDDTEIVEELVRLSDVETGLALGARWDEIEAPLGAAGELSPAARAPLGPLGSRRN